MKTQTIRYQVQQSLPVGKLILKWFRTLGDTGWYSQKWGGGWYMSDSSWIRAYSNKNVYTGGQIRGGSVQADGRLTVGEFAQLNGVANAGASCS
jgi:hypothetical protein